MFPQRSLLPGSRAIRPNDITADASIRSGEKLKPLCNSPVRVPTFHTMRSSLSGSIRLMQNSIVHPSKDGIRLHRGSMASKFAVFPGLSLFMLIASSPARAAEQVKIPMTADRWTTMAGTVNFIEFKGKPSIELKAGNYAQHIQTGAVALNNLTFRNGTIEYDVAATSDMGAGFVFRRADKDNYEMFYLRPRPKCEEAPDCVQYAPETHGVLLWDMFPQYQGPAPLRQDEWNHIKLVVSGSRMNVFVNDAAEPTLKIGRLEGDKGEGGLRLQGPGIFANLVVT